MSDEVKLIVMAIFVLIIVVISAVSYDKLIFSKNDMAIPTILACIYAGLNFALGLSIILTGN